MILVSKKSAIVCSILSCWAIIMLVLMGMFLYARALTFAEDLELEEAVSEYSNIEEFVAEAYKRYASAAHNCWIAACFYIATLAFSLHQYYTNRRVQYGF